MELNKMTSITTRVQQHRERLRRAGLRPVQIWVPDTRRKDFVEECRRQSAIVASNDKADRELVDLIDESLNSIEGWE